MMILFLLRTGCAEKELTASRTNVCLTNSPSFVKAFQQGSTPYFFHSLLEPEHVQKIGSNYAE